MTEELNKLFLEYFNEPVVSYLELPEHASKRKLVRLSGAQHKCIGVFHTDTAENRTFIEFSKSMRSVGLPVPQIYKVSKNNQCYLEQDLGDVTLYQVLEQERQQGLEFSDKLYDLYAEALSFLVQFQVQANKVVDFKLCFQGEKFDEQAMLGDMQAFEQNYLKVANLQYSAQEFELQSKKFVRFLAEAKNDFFMYRDFQARNIMVSDSGLHFIDYQTGRKGPLQYDVVSLLYQSQARIPEEQRVRLLNFYLSELGTEAGIKAEDFNEHFYGFVVLRLFQVLATYGREGLLNKKEYFLQGIPIAQQVLKDTVSKTNQLADYPELRRLATL